MSGFIEGADRGQGFLLPEHIDEYVTEDNPVRVVDAFIEELDLRKLGFDGVEAKATGRPGYHPATLLKIYLYGYLNRIQSSRRLEREAQRNLELMWLTGRLAPDFKTLADFRADNGAAIRAVCREFVLLCRRMGLLSQTLVAIDGSKFKAVNHRDKNFTTRKMKLRMEAIEQSITNYLEQLDKMDGHESAHAPAKRTRLSERIAALKAEMARLEGLKTQMDASADGQVSLVDPDARSMSSKGRGSGIVGYNVQTVVEPENHLIIDHDVTNVGNDRSQLSRMAKSARETLACDNLTAVADRGYFKSEEILECSKTGIAAVVPRPVTSSATANSRFGRDEFRYLPEEDEYRCPANERLIKRFTTVENGLTQHKYWSSACGSCTLKARCTPSPQRRMTRWEHEDLLEDMQARLDEDPTLMQVRRQTVEHPFGTIKAWMGATHFLTRTIKRVSTEMSLHVLAYNMKRVIKIMGTGPLIAAIRA